MPPCCPLGLQGNVSMRRVLALRGLELLQAQGLRIERGSKSTALLTDRCRYLSILMPLFWQ